MLRLSRKTAIAMYSGQPDSIAAICVYADKYPANDIVLLNIKSGFRVDNDDSYIDYNCNKLMNRFQNIVSFKRSQDWEMFTELCIRPLNYSCPSLNGGIVCVGCMCNVYAQALFAAEKMKILHVITGFRAKEKEFQEGTVLNYLFNEIQKEYRRANVEYLTPIKSVINNDELMKIVKGYLGEIKQAEYSCLFRYLKKMGNNCDERTASRCRKLCKEAFDCARRSENFN